MFAEIPAMTIRYIKETKRYLRTDAQINTSTYNVKTLTQTQFAGVKEWLTNNLVYIR